MTNTQILDSIHTENNNINSLVLKIPIPIPMADSNIMNSNETGMLLRSNVLLFRSVKKSKIPTFFKI